MKNLMRKFTRYVLPAVLIFGSVLIFTPEADAGDNYRYERVCSNGRCIVYVYSQDGSLVNIYEELDP